jgi:hypothetical protein
VPKIQEISKDMEKKKEKKRKETSTTFKRRPYPFFYPKYSGV